MEYIKVCGGKSLEGDVRVQGSKNASLPIISATVLSQGECVLENCPDLSDTRVAVEILKYLGAECEFYNNTLCVDTKNIKNRIIDASLMGKLRSSITFAGALVGRFGEAVLAMPGGCQLGPRPIDMHIKSFKKLGTEVECRGGYICLKGKPRGGEVVLAFPSVGATQNAMLAATRANGDSTIINCAKEPEIVCLQNFLNACGAKVSGAGSAVIHISGCENLHGAKCIVDADRIAAATYLACFLASGGNGSVSGVDASCLNAIISEFEKMGAKINIYDDIIEIQKREKLKPIMIQTQPYPGFPTDCLPIMTAIASTICASSVFSENIFKNRFDHTYELAKMGADVHIFGKTCVIKGKERLCAAELDSCDLRGGASAIIASLAADGVSYIKNPCYIDRGYENICEILRGLGAEITRTDKGAFV